MSRRLRSHRVPHQRPKVTASIPEIPSTTEDPKVASKKVTQYSRYANSSPFLDFQRPSPQECRTVYNILTKLHGDRDPTAADAMNADGFDRPSGFADPLDGLIYGVLCQATNERNGIRQVKSMTRNYGSWTNHKAIVKGGETKLQQVLSCGGLHIRKSKIIMSILRQVKAKHSTYSLDHLWSLPDEEVMEEMLGYNGIGPKTASCVMALTLSRQRFVVDTHIYRITGWLGWRPIKATAEQTRAHLETKIPDDLKYALHLQFITHGRECPECKAGGKRLGDCELRNLYRDDLSA